MRQLIGNRSAVKDNKPILIIMEDVHISEKNNIFKPIEFLRMIRDNGNRMMSTESSEFD